MTKKSWRSPPCPSLIKLGIPFIQWISGQHWILAAIHSAIWQLSWILAPGQRMTVLLFHMSLLWLLIFENLMFAIFYQPRAMCYNTLYDAVWSCKIVFLEYSKADKFGRNYYIFSLYIFYSIFSHNRNKLFIASLPMFPGLWHVKSRWFFSFFPKQLRILSWDKDQMKLYDLGKIPSIRHGQMYNFA